MRTITVSALNIVMPAPHNAQRYIDLFQRAYSMKRPINLRGDFAGMIGSCRVEELNGSNVVKGEFYKFFDLKLDGQWFNTLEQKPAEDTELAEIHIPDYLKPHFEIFSFVFFPTNHRLFFVTKDQLENFSPIQAQKMLSVIFEDLMLVREFGEIEITVEPSVETLQRIFSMPRLKYLHIEVTPPNPDDHEEAELKLFNKMGELGADKQIVELLSKKPSGLHPDADIRMLAEIAQSNGKVSGRGEDETGQTISVSTAEHPMQEKIEFNPITQQRSEALISKALELLQRIIRRH
jgi:Domain of unknown function (DUF4747)